MGVNYAASKAEVIGLPQTLGRELGPSGICVDAIASGPILTEQSRQYCLSSLIERVRPLI